VLAERGFFDESLLDSYNSLGTIFPGHPDMQKVPGVETSTGALGHGLSIAGGMALAAKMDNLDSRVYVTTGDGEIEEGAIWEAAAAATHYRLDNLLVFVDRNRLQISGPTTEVMNYEPLAKRWEAFGWCAREIDGHNMSEIVRHATDIPFEKGKPSVIMANTIKSKGIKFAENKPEYHQWTATPEQLTMAESDLDEIGRGLGL
jgi:transketolase